MNIAGPICPCDTAARNRRYTGIRHVPLPVSIDEDGMASCRFCWEYIEPERAE